MGGCLSGHPLLFYRKAASKSKDWEAAFYNIFYL